MGEHLPFVQRYRTYYCFLFFCFFFVKNCYNRYLLKNLLHQKWDCIREFLEDRWFINGYSTIGMGEFAKLLTKFFKSLSVSGVMRWKKVRGTFNRSNRELTVINATRLDGEAKQCFSMWNLLEWSWEKF